LFVELDRHLGDFENIFLFFPFFSQETRRRQLADAAEKRQKEV